MQGSSGLSQTPNKKSMNIFEAVTGNIFVGFLQAELSRERMKVKMEELIAQTGVTYEALNKTFDVTSNPQYEDQLNLVKDLQAKIVELQV